MRLAKDPQKKDSKMWRHSLLKWVLSLLPISCSALPVNNPYDPAMFSEGLIESCCPLLSCDYFNVRIGYCQDEVWNRHMQSTIKHNHANIKSTEISTSSGLIALNFLGWCNLFANLGASSFEVTTPDLTFFNSEGGNPLVTVTTETHFSYTLGAQFLIWNRGPFFFGCEGKYFFSNPRITMINEPFASWFVTYPEPDVHLKYKEWQIDFALGCRVPFACYFDAIPYAAFYAAHATIDMGNTTEQITAFIPLEIHTITLPNLRTRRNWGYALGIDLVAAQLCSLGIEARFIGERAFSFKAQTRF